MQPRVIDNDQDTITVEHGGKVVREYSYRNDDERRERMVRAREHVEGWCKGGSAKAERIKYSIDTRFNNYLCEMKPDYDDSITGFNEAWDITRKVFAEDWAR